jgi:NitT/TauT family transport system permease protein
VLIGAAWTLPVGVWIGLSPKWSQRLQPVIQVVASFPAPMLFPLVTTLLLALHVPFTIGCIALMLLGAQWYILFNVIAGATAIPADLKEVATVNRMSRWQVWTTLYLPCVFPYLLTGLITAAGGAWNASIVSEYVNFSDKTYTAFGLGSTISHATAEGNFSLLCAAVVSMAVFVVLVNRVFWKRLYRIAENRFSLNV